MGNPLPPAPGVLDTNAISWAEYGAKRGIYRLLDGLGRSGVKSSVMTNAVLAEANYQWHGDVMDDDLPYVQTFGERKLVAIPLNTDVNDMPFMRYGRVPESMLTMFENVVARGIARERGPYIVDVTVHAHIFGRPGGVWVVDRIAEIVAGSRELWTGTRAEMASHILSLGAQIPVERGSQG